MIFSKEVNKDGLIYRMIQLVFGRGGVSPITCGFFFQGVWCMILATLAITSAGGVVALIHQLLSGGSTMSEDISILSTSPLGYTYGLAFLLGTVVAISAGLVAVLMPISLALVYIGVVLATGCVKRDSIGEAIENQEYLPWVEFMLRVFNKAEEMRKKFKEKYCKPISFK